MISRFLILTILTLCTSNNLQKVPNLFAPAKQTAKTLAYFTQNGGKKNYFIGDPNKFLKSSYYLVTSYNHLYEIFMKKQIKTFIYIVHNIDNSKKFLSDVAHEIGNAFDKDKEARSYLLILFVVDSRKFFYRLGRDVKDSVNAKTLKETINKYLPLLKQKNYYDLIVKLTENLMNDIVNKKK